MRTSARCWLNLGSAGIGGLLFCSTFACLDPTTVGGLCPAARGCRTDAAAMAGAGDGETMGGAGGAVSTSGAGTCSEGSEELARIRLDLILVVDDTASVVPWLPALYDGLLQLFRREEWSGIGIGLQRFDEVCDPQYYTELIVPIAPLPENASALEAAISVAPTLTTSTSPALAGALQHARDRSASQRDTQVAVVLLTDASPGACDGLTGDPEAAQKIAREGLQGVPSIKTYVVGFGNLDALSAIARAGGTEPLLISFAPAEGEVLAALDSVRRNAQPACGPP